MDTRYDRWLGTEPMATEPYLLTEDDAIGFPDLADVDTYSPCDGGCGATVGWYIDEDPDVFPDLQLSETWLMPDDRLLCEECHTKATEEVE